MSEALSEAGQWAVVLSPLVAVGVFAGSLFYDRVKRRAATRSDALVRARTALMQSANWTTLPFPLSSFGGWQMRLFDGMSALAASIPARKYGDLSIWLVEGAVNLVKESSSAGRIDIQSKLSQALFEQSLYGRRGLRSAQLYARENPWREPTSAPIVWRVLTEVGAITLRAAAGDPTYARGKTRE